MIGAKDITVTETALGQAKTLMPFKTEADIVQMVRDSARVTHPMGNRRFEHYVFLVDKGMVKSISRFSNDVVSSTACAVCGGSKQLITYDGCGLCDWSGCWSCRLVRPCPECSK